MQWWIGSHWFIKALCFALLVEEGILVRLVDQKVELEVAPRELHAARNGCPFAEGDGLAIGSALGEGVATVDVLLQHIA